MDSFKIEKMRTNKIIITSVFTLLTLVMNAQELIQAGKYDDLMSAPEIAIARGGTLMDWANMKFYEERNEKLKKTADPNRVVFMGNSITQGWSHFNPRFFRDNPFVDRGIGGQTSPQMLLRLADVILLRAEALNQLGNTGEAITLLNQVRARVELAPTTATSKADVAKAILDERRLELFMENSRYWDLKRYYNDDAAFVQYLNSLTESDGTSLEYKATLNNIFMPIPQKEMDINEYLVQRPGY